MFSCNFFKGISKGFAKKLKNRLNRVNSFVCKGLQERILPVEAVYKEKYIFVFLSFFVFWFLEADKHFSAGLVEVFFISAIPTVSFPVRTVLSGRGAGG